MFKARLALAVLFLLPSAQAFASSTGGGSSTVPVRSVTSGTSDTAQQNDGLILVQSNTAGPFTENVMAGTANGQTLQVGDGNANASTYPVTLVAGAGATIGGQSSIMLSDNSFEISLKWDNVSNWIITSYYNGSKTITNPSYLLVNSSGTVLSIDGTNFLRLF